MKSKYIAKSIKFKPEEAYLINMALTADENFSKAIKIIIKEWHDMKTNTKSSLEDGSTKEMLERLLQYLEDGNISDSSTIKETKKKVMLDIASSEL